MAILLAVVSIAACKGGDSTGPGDGNDPSEPPVGSVTVEPRSVTLHVGGTAQLTATVRSTSGAVLTGRRVTWVSRNSSVVAVSSEGVVTGRLAGSAVISAESEGKVGTATVTVNPEPVSDDRILLQITPERASPDSEAAANRRRLW